MVTTRRLATPLWGPAVLHGVRTAAAVGVFLGNAFWLELDDAYWAGTTAAIVCQPMLGSSLRKAVFRTYGTLVGAVAGVMLWAAFPQDPFGFCLGLAGWCATCGFLSYRLTFFAAYGAQLAGYTAAIIAGDVVNHPDLAFGTVLARLSEIEVGIVVATTILSATQRDTSRTQLAAALDALARDALSSLESSAFDAERLLLRLLDLDGLIDRAVGEAAYRKLLLGPVRAARNGLFDCIAAAVLIRHANQGGRWPALTPRAATPASCRTAAKTLCAVPGTGSRLPADGVVGAATALEVAAWLGQARGMPLTSGADCPAPVDPLAALVTAGRVYLGIVAAVVIWIATAWPNGPGAITWAAITLLLMSPLHEKAFHAAAWFAAGTTLTVILAGLAKFAVLPAFDGLWGLSAAPGLFLVPLAALSSHPRLSEQSRAVITPEWRSLKSTSWACTSRPTPSSCWRRGRSPSFCAASWPAPTCCRLSGTRPC